MLLLASWISRVCIVIVIRDSFEGGMILPVTWFPPTVQLLYMPDVDQRLSIVPECPSG